MHLPVNLYIGATSSLQTFSSVTAGVRYYASHAASSSTSKNPFPFPSQPNPTPHQIFHLYPSASNAEIKSRYYELAKYFHPDTAPQDGASPEARRERFQRITAAYKQLRRGRGRNNKFPTLSEIHSNRRWTGKMNQWGGFQYEYDHDPNEKAGTEDNWATSANPVYHRKSFQEMHAPYWIFFSGAFIWAVVQFIYVSPSQEAWKANRRAIQALGDAQKNREEYGSQRREGIKLWAELQNRSNGTKGDQQQGKGVDEPTPAD
ncbi:hypothetical protein FRB96_002596 [Tulasnella sp. 330]|nr:hypothetical protein FRB96_002596 [Tulasnella sp. 330]KAG8874624.1 hypothetical protein FRB98_008343 [Tulasnella sp. 332]